jgi:hypothetical protein
VKNLTTNNVQNLTPVILKIIRRKTLIDKWRGLLRRAGDGTDHPVVEVGADIAKKARLMTHVNTGV